MKLFTSRRFDSFDIDLAPISARRFCRTSAERKLHARISCFIVDTLLLAALANQHWLEMGEGGEGEKQPLICILLFEI